MGPVAGCRAFQLLDNGRWNHRQLWHIRTTGFPCPRPGPLIIPAEARSPSGHQEGPKGPKACSPSGQIDLEKAKCLITIRTPVVSGEIFEQNSVLLRKFSAKSSHPDTKIPQKGYPRSPIQTPKAPKWSKCVRTSNIEFWEILIWPL